MPTAWRLVKKRHAGSAFDGEGARRFGGRWNSPGTSVVYASETRALCLLEVLAGLRSVTPLQAYVVIPATFDDAVLADLPAERLPAAWRQSPPHPNTQRIGDEWADRQQSAVLRVPSVLVPDEFNYLLNPAHSDFARIEIGAAEELTIDSRSMR
jgi:RES domain-containing protein